MIKTLPNPATDLLNRACSCSSCSSLLFFLSRRRKGNNMFSSSTSFPLFPSPLRPKSHTHVVSKLVQQEWRKLASFCGFPKKYKDIIFFSRSSYTPSKYRISPIHIDSDREILVGIFCEYFSLNIREFVEWQLNFSRRRPLEVCPCHFFICLKKPRKNTMTTSEFDFATHTAKEIPTHFLLTQTYQRNMWTFWNTPESISFAVFVVEF